VVALDWDHNAYHWPLLLGLLPPDCERVLDVGCGGLLQGHAASLRGAGGRGCF